MSVTLVWTIVTQMPHVLTLLEASSADVIQGSLEVGQTVMVSY